MKPLELKFENYYSSVDGSKPLSSEYCDEYPSQSRVWKCCHGFCDKHHVNFGVPWTPYLANWAHECEKFVLKERMFF